MDEQNKITCPACEGTNIKDQTKYLNIWNHSLFNHKNINICSDCGFGFISKELKESELQYYYNHEYRNENSPIAINYKKLPKLKGIVDARSQAQILLARQYLEKTHKVSFLEIGSGPGYSLSAAESLLGKDSSISVVEANNEALEYYNKNIKNVKAYNSIQDVDYELDFILLSHSLEHFNPSSVEELLSSLFKMLEPGGIILIEVPHIDLRKDIFINQRFNDTPHLCFFTIESLKKIISKSAFELEFISTAGIPIGQAYSLAMNKIRESSLSTLRRQRDKGRLIILKEQFLSLLRRPAGYTFRKLFGKKIMSDALASPQFSYGDNLDCIRCIAKKPHYQ